PGSSLAQVLELRAPWLGPLPAHDPMARLVGRAPATALLLPLVIGERIVGALYGDRGAADVPAEIFQELVVVLGHAGAAFRRLARTRARGRGPVAPAARHADEPNVVDARGGSDPLQGAISLSAGTLAVLDSVAPPTSDQRSTLRLPEPP
ncbi:MAG: hypothetical protein ACO3JL_10635, partial [Myxococcota bacterium]